MLLNILQYSATLSTMILPIVTLVILCIKSVISDKQVQSQPNEDGIPKFDLFSPAANVVQVILKQYLKDFDSSSIAFVNSIKRSNTALVFLQEYRQEIDGITNSNCDLALFNRHYDEAKNTIHNIVDKCVKNVPKEGREDLKNAVIEALKEVHTLDEKLKVIFQTDDDSPGEIKSIIDTLNSFKKDSGRIHMDHLFKNALFFRYSYMDSCVEEESVKVLNDVREWHSEVLKCGNRE